MPDVTTPTPEFIENDDLSGNERDLIKCALSGQEYRCFDEARKSVRLEELQKKVTEKYCTIQLFDKTLENLAVREQAEADGAPEIRAELIRFLVRGGNEK